MLSKDSFKSMTNFYLMFAASKHNLVEDTRISVIHASQLEYPKVHISEESNFLERPMHQR